MPSTIHRNLLTALLLFVSAMPAPAGAAVAGSWSALGPEGGVAQTLASPPGNPQVVYAGVFGGIYKSVDGGATWNWAGRGLDPGTSVWSLAVNPIQPSRLWAGQDSGLFKSVDAGATWKPTALPYFTTVYQVVLHPRSPQTVFAVSRAGLYQTTDGGGRWRRLNRKPLQALVIDPSSPRRMFAAPQSQVQGGLLRSLDGGLSWQAVVSNLPKQQSVKILAFDPLSPALYAGTAGGLFRSADYGRTWARLSLPVPTSVACLAFHPAQAKTLYAGGWGGLFRSVDGGATWSAARNLPPGADVRGLVLAAASPATLVAAVALPSTLSSDQSGVFKSTDGGDLWVPSSRGLTALWVPSIAVDPRDSHLLWITANSQLLRSVDRGRIWLWTPPLPTFTDSRLVLISPADPETLYLGLFSGKIVRRDGAFWVESGNPGTYTRALKADPRDRSTLWATEAEGGIRKSTNGGDSWSSLPGLAAQGVFLDLAFSPSSPATVYASGSFNDKARVLRSTDSGATWTVIQNGLPPDAGPLAAGPLAVDPLQSQTVYMITTGGDFYKTADGGSTWSLVNGDFRGRKVQLLTAAPSGSLYLAVGYDNVYESADGGQSWAPLGEAPRPYMFTDLAADPLDPCRVYAATYDRGLLAFTKSGTPVCP